MPQWVKRIKWWVEFGVLYGLYLISRVLPRRWLLGLGNLLGLFVWHILRIRRGVVLGNLRSAYGGRRTEAELHDLARRSFCHLGTILMEFFAMARMNPQEILGLVTVEGLERLQTCRQENKGALLTSGHLGNWELLGAAVAAHDFPVSYMAKRQSNPYVEKVHNEIRNRVGIRIIHQGASVRQLVKAIQRKEFVGLLGDQDGGGQGVFVEFLGRPASVFRGAAFYAYRLKCPIIPCAMFRQRDGSYRIVVTEPIVADPSWDEETAVVRLTQQHTQRLENFIHQAPEQYFWVHRRWKTQPPETNGVQITPQG
jgi:KDO2-lipid IV(A) lauroyltransferase